MRTTFVVGGLALLLAAGGCATTRGPRSASGKPISKEALAAAEKLVDEKHVIPPLRKYYVALYAEGRENQALHAMRAGLAAMQFHQWDLAAQTFDDAIRDVESLQEGAAQAERAKGKFVAEQEKWFKGESYERSALYLYRGIVYLQKQDFGNAAACFKRSELQDVTGDDAPGFAGDWYSSELALALASYKNGVPEDAERALQRTRSFTSKPGEVPPPRPNNNLLLVVESGRGPIKYRGGKYGERLYYREVPDTVREVEVLIDGNSVIRSPAAENLYLQATTRGKRQVDYILAGKATFKQATAVTSAVLATGAGIASENIKNERDRNIATGVLAGLSFLSGAASAATKPQADVRRWNNLPHSVYVIGLTVASSAQEFEVRGLGVEGEVVSSQHGRLVRNQGAQLDVLHLKLKLGGEHATD